MDAIRAFNANRPPRSDPLVESPTETSVDEPEDREDADAPAEYEAHTSPEAAPSTQDEPSTETVSNGAAMDVDAESDDDAAKTSSSENADAEPEESLPDSPGENEETTTTAEEVNPSSEPEPPTPEDAGDSAAEDAVEKAEDIILPEGADTIVPEAGEEEVLPADVAPEIDAPESPADEVPDQQNEGEASAKETTPPLSPLDHQDEGDASAKEGVTDTPPTLEAKKTTPCTTPEITEPRFTIKIDRCRLPTRYQDVPEALLEGRDQPPPPPRHIIKIKFTKTRAGAITRQVIPYYPRHEQRLPEKPVKRQKIVELETRPTKTKEPKLAKGYVMEPASAPQAPKLGSEPVLVPESAEDEAGRHGRQIGADKRAANQAAAQKAKLEKEYQERLLHAQELLCRLSRAAELNNKERTAERNKPVPKPIAPAPPQAMPVAARAAPRHRALSARNSDTASMDLGSSSHTPLNRPARPARPNHSKYSDDFIEDPSAELMQPELLPAHGHSGYGQPAPYAPYPSEPVAARPAIAKTKPLKQWDRSVMMGERGGDQDMLRKCTEVLTAMMRHKLAWPFNEPVNAKALGLVDYHDIIRNPMDMGTIRSRQYSSADEFCHDMRLVFDNAMTYNPEPSDVHQMGHGVLDAFEKKWTKLLELSRKPPQQPKARSVTVYKDDLPGYGDDDLPLPGARSRQSGGGYRKGETAEERKVRDLEAKLEAMQRQQSLLLQRVNMGGGGAVGGNFADPETDSVGGGGSLAADRGLKAFIDPHRAMSLEQKRELSFNFKKLPDDKLLVAVDIIRDNMPVDNDADDIVIDIDSLDNKTLWELKEFIDKAMPRKGGFKRKNNSGGGQDNTHQSAPSKSAKKQKKAEKKQKPSGGGSDSDSSSSSSSSSDSDSDSDDPSSAASDAEKKSAPTSSHQGGANTYDEGGANTYDAYSSAPAASAAPAYHPPAPAAPAPVATSPAPASSQVASSGGWTSGPATAAPDKKPLAFSLGGGMGASKPKNKKPIELKNTNSWLNLGTSSNNTTVEIASAGNALWDEHRNKAQQAKERDQQMSDVESHRRADEQRVAEKRRQQEETEAAREQDIKATKQQQEESHRESMEEQRKNAREAERQAREDASEGVADSARFETEAGLGSGSEDDDFGLDSMGYGSAMGM